MLSGCLLIAHSVASAENFVLADEDSVFGEPGTVQAVYEDTLLDIARRYRLGFTEITDANPAVDKWLPGEGTVVSLPTQFVLPQVSRKGLVINLAEYRMYYFSRSDDNITVSTFPISIGRMNWKTPLGRSKIVSKVEKPSWYPPASIRKEWADDGRTLASRVPAGPDNPLGDYAMRLSIPGYLIHGTNKPAGVGMRVTHGCIRMFPEDIEWLFPQIPVNAGVQIVNQPYKLGWVGDELYLEVHTPLDTEEGEFEESLTSITELYIAVTKDRVADVDWDLMTKVFSQKLGIPVKVGQRVMDSTPPADDTERVSAAL
jgi:L,D-transpeptidase ErfK/SrfK